MNLPSKDPTVLLRMARVALTPRKWLLKTRLSNGAYVFGENRPGHGGRGIYIYRDALEPEFEHLEQFLEPGGVFLDVGANTGIYTLKAAKFFQKNQGTVISVEPFVGMLAMLDHNVRANGFGNVRLRNFCLGDRSHSAEVWMNFGRPTQFSTDKRDDQASSFQSMILALDDIFPWEGLNRLDYVKIDVEGVEQKVLAGAVKTLGKYRPIIQIEVSINSASVQLANYTAFQAPGSQNKVCIPNENKKIAIPPKLGWQQLGQ